uniref:Uncharacterized protein n=1 Tax=viral metagenome TaxID=1070528 RepID=A0A6C0I101_9ZZZZ
MNIFNCCEKELQLQSCKINETTFYYTMDTSDEITIKSYNKNYNVIYKNDIDQIMNIYNANDFIIIDKNVFELYKNILSKIDQKYYYIFNAIEDNKNIHSILSIIDLLYELKMTKKNKLIVIGGGITQDICGFLSAIYKRGLSWVYIPTTLLSMTDSCIGSKVNINYNTKNLLGLFYAPDQIIIYEQFLSTLHHDDIISGLSEALKISLIGGYKTYNYFIENMNSGLFLNIIKMASVIKKMIIEKDELEKNERKVLNYGHTFGHALEIVSKYDIPHGIAVLFGMIMINKLFYHDKYDDINKYMFDMIPQKFTQLNLSYDTFIDCILNDKKNDGDNICFIILENIGETRIIYKKLGEINDKLQNIFHTFF